MCIRDRLHPLDREARPVISIGVAAAAGIGVDGLLAALEGDDLVSQAVAAEEICDVELRRGALLGADRGAVELKRRSEAQLGANHKAFAAVEINAGEVEAERGICLLYTSRCV